ncbi:GTP-binding protein RAB1Y (ISS) [Oopsacas minuta]|uniref:GTP-binding protein RAB1Y (ISS) n=1 Tax=Oopsacas minuta TaxID=111878 RepID=A0AAV7JPF3_9METZ|nr:GTP-binding protein RAB1Y (ISS) [Oopsacas minuta]
MAEGLFNEKNILKFVVVGEPSVGKSSIINRYIYESENFPVTSPGKIGMEVHFKRVILRGRETELQIWDMHGADPCLMGNFSLTRMNGILLVYDVTASESLGKLESWLKEIENYTTLASTPRVLVGNKIDLESERSVERRQGLKC